MKKLSVDDLRGAIKKALSETDQKSFLVPSEDEYNELIEACRSFLLYSGYKVIEPVKYSYNIKKLDDLIDLFYAMLYNKHPEWAGGNISWDRYRGTAKQFVGERMKSSGLSKERAMNECGEIIKTIFDYEKDFNFNRPLSFGIFGQKNCGWITDKAVQIMNRESMNKESRKQKALISSYEKSYESEDTGFKDLDEILEKIKQNK